MVQTEEVSHLVSLLKQLQAVVVASHGSEITRLLNEICVAVRAVPTFTPVMSIATSSAVGIDVELAMQPLRNENTQLRRQLRIARQQLREKDELVSAVQKPDESYQVLHLTMLVRHLEKQLEESRTEAENLRRRLELVTEECERTAREKTSALQVVARKEDEHARTLEDHVRAMRQAQAALDVVHSEKAELERKLSELREGLHKLTLQLQHKEEQNQRSHDLVRNLQESMSHLVHDLQSSRPVGSSVLMSGRLNETLTTITEQLSQLEPTISFATPPLRAQEERTPQSTAKRFLDFGGCGAPSQSQVLHDDLDLSSFIGFAPLRHENISAISTVASATPPRQSLGGVPTTVKALLTPIAQRLQNNGVATTTASLTTVTGLGNNGATMFARRQHHPTDNRSDVTSTDEVCYDNDDDSDKADGLDETLTELHPLPDPIIAGTFDDSDQSRWSASDYFHKYPQQQQSYVDSLNHSSTVEMKMPLLGGTRGTLAVNLVSEQDDLNGFLYPLTHQSDVTESGCSPLPPSSDAGSVETATSLDSVSTEDDFAFRVGLAQLDANIARIQRQLRGSASSPMVTDVTATTRLSLDSADSAP
jgi:CII-binding regulator of phage lambda lysogenization HflD